MDLWVDLETYNETSIRDGTHRYAGSDSAEIMLFAWAIDDEDPQVWDLTAGEPMPERLHAALVDPTVLLWAHNSAFDRSMLRYSLTHTAFAVAGSAIERWRDTMVKALCHGLPGALAAVCRILNVPLDESKDAEGRELVMLFCKPRPRNSKLRRATRHTHPAEWARFVSYAGQDITAMRAANKRLPVWNYRGDELALWHLDQRINDRGFCVDTELVAAAIRAVSSEQTRLAAQTVEATGGEVASATQRDQLLRYILLEYGVALPDMQKDTLERRIQDPDLPIELRELLALRLESSTTSTAKYKTLQRVVSRDGRMRGGLQYSGAQRTRRWAGRLFQPQNLPRPSMSTKAIEAAIDVMKLGVEDLVMPKVMDAASNAVRGCIVAAPRRKLVPADLSNIEGRLGAWTSGESWKLAAFSAFDAGEGSDLYKVAYSRAFNIAPEDVTKDERQVGKVMELMLQYEGGVGAFVTGAATYRVDLDDLARRAPIPTWAREEAVEFLAWMRDLGRSTFGLPDEVFIVCDALKRMWRRQHPRLVQMWADLKRAFALAALNEGLLVTVGPFRLMRQGAWLRLRLPSGNYLCYPSPVVKGEEGYSQKLAYKGVNQYTRQWGLIGTYGGKLFENICQSLSRDVMAANMPAIEAAGYDIILTVHDEVITEPPDDQAFTAERLSRILAIVPPWAPGLPLAAAGFEAYRYGKH